MKKGLSFELIGEKGNNRPSSNMRGIKEGDVHSHNERRGNSAVLVEVG